ncbi:MULTISPECIES: thiol reductant ABC exporter subunit CydC [Pontibacillus]|uniref:Thiol reductant ABC exporter subunit CydC n=1 Tax=Pontibacillus chungwhensis TaxID=265426 RepID=A0ABY8UUJ2_9BACI|nr:thiol reductant ABC exporter subunit CydC [Pontibacillus chungwhensis]MCD5325086.1 thiol reductant ABC exporter subunit CydC [Pontibacillus sp. HN14]WIF97337.1 thiol reductant ABC exporter subunit CydC [Pontibacillus chungwhensis]
MNELRAVVKDMMVEKRDIYLSVLFGFLAGITAVALFASSGYLISKAALLPPIYTLSLMIAFLKIMGFARAFGRYLERLYSHRATFTMLSQLRVNFYEKLEPLAPKIFHKYRSGDLLSRIVSDIDRLQNFFLRVYYPPIVLGLIFFATILFTVFYSITVALLLLFGLFLTGVILPAWFAFKQRRIEVRLREERGALSSEVTEFLYGFMDLKLYQQLDAKEKELEEASVRYIDEQEKEGKMASYHQSLNSMVTLLVSWLVIAFGAYLVANNQLDGVFLAMLIMISLTVFENAVPMALVPAHFEDSRRAAKRLHEVVQDEEEQVEVTSSLPVDQAFSIDLKGVSFSFPGEERDSLKDVTLHIPAGSKTAIVGASGSGKSTLFQLLLKFYNPASGSILFNETPQHEVSQEDIWARTNVVQQENHYFYGTIRDNLQIADEHAGDDRLYEVLTHVDLSHFDLDQSVLEKGENLSGGEKQRLAIARALLKDESLWLLDEPTSSLDAVTEQHIYEHVFQRAKHDTLILISHRLMGLEKMDQIIVLDQGEVVESGSYQELMRHEGYFYRMKQIEKEVLV